MKKFILLASLLLTSRIVHGYSTVYNPWTGKLDYVSSGTVSGGSGDIEGVTAGDGLTGGGSSGSVTLNVGVSAPLTISADAIGVDSSSATLLGPSIGLTSEVTGTLPVANGGTNLTAASDDNVMVGNGTTWQSKSISDCDNATTSKLLYDAGANAFSCGSDQNTGGLGSGATMYSQLGDLKVTRTSSTNLGIGENCSATNPCIVRIGDNTYRFLSSSTVTLGGSSVSSDGSSARIYVASNGELTVGLDSNFTSANVTCTGCTKASPISAFPSDSVPLYTWLAGTTDNQWDSSGEEDQRASLSSDMVQPGSGISTNGTEVSVDSALVPFLASTQTFTGQNTFTNQVTISTAVAGVTKLSFSDGTSMTTASSGSGSTFALTGKMAMIPFPDWPLKFTTNLVVSTKPVVQPLIVDSSMTITRVTFYIGTGVGTGCTGGVCGIKWALYNSACDTKLAESTPFTTGGTTGVVSSTMTVPYTITPGAYCLMMATDSSVAAIATPLTSSAMNGITNHVASGGPRIGTCANETTGNGAALTLPSACGTITATDRIWNGTFYP